MGIAITIRWAIRWIDTLLYTYLLIVGVAELLGALADPWISLAIYILLLAILILHAGLERDIAARRLALALTLVPLLRILLLVLPLENIPRLAWYPIVLVPLLVSALLVIRQAQMSRSMLGLRSGNVLLQLMLMGGGLGVGAAEYFVFGAPQPLTTLSWSGIPLLLVALLVFTGVVEELIFRGLLQAIALPALGRWSPIYVSLLFAALQFSYLSAPIVVFAFGIGLIFAYVTRWSGSIIGVSLAHGLANVTLFVLMPLLAQQQASPTTILVHSVIAAGTTLAIVAMAILIVHARLLRRAARLLRRLSPGRPPTRSRVRSPSRRPSARLLARPAPHRYRAPDLAQAESLIRTLRRIAGLTYVELSDRTQLPDALLAEIERGLHHPKKEHLGRIFQALGVDRD